MLYDLYVIKVRSGWQGWAKGYVSNLADVKHFEEVTTEIHTTEREALGALMWALYEHEGGAFTVQTVNRYRSE